MSALRKQRCGQGCGSRLKVHQLPCRRMLFARPVTTRRLQFQFQFSSLEHISIATSTANPSKLSWEWGVGVQGCLESVSPEQVMQNHENSWLAFSGVEQGQYDILKSLPGLFVSVCKAKTKWKIFINMETDKRLGLNGSCSLFVVFAFPQFLQSSHLGSCHSSAGLLFLVVWVKEP